jgi:single-strand DNA-binding protein
MIITRLRFDNLCNFVLPKRKKKLKFKNMNTLRNSVRLVGNLGMDPEVKNFDKNKKLTRLSLATNESYKNDKGEKITETQWHNLTLWGTQAKFAEDYLKKGDEVAIEGRIANRNYTDKDGIKRYSCEIVVNELLKLSGKN